MISDLFKQMEDLSATKVCRRSPFLRSRVAKENLSKEIVMNTVPAKPGSWLVVRKLNNQIGVPDLLP